MASNANILAIIRQHSLQQALPTNTFLFQQGDRLRDVHLLEKGLVKMTRGEQNGQEVTVDLRFAGSLLGAVTAFANEPATMTALTVTSCEVYRLSVKEFLKLAEGDVSFLQDLAEQASRQRNELVIRQGQQLLPARVRLAMLLLRFAKEFGRERKGQLSLALPLAKQEIAGMLGITPVHLSRLLREMKGEGLIVEEKEWIILRDRQALMDVTGTGEKSGNGRVLISGLNSKSSGTLNIDSVRA
ncbi:MAG: Crp/Fnr family transcriptional regulator [Blastocatellia bacterium]|nr:Crp/Fnr family transcriptional regulator [Blastocatellia bacterium]